MKDIHKGMKRKFKKEKIVIIGIANKILISKLKK